MKQLGGVTPIADQRDAMPFSYLRQATNGDSALD
jgi:hypothetical protein